MKNAAEIKNELFDDVRNMFINADKAHDFCHTERVMRIALQMQRQIKSDAEIVYLVALLHDVDDKKVLKTRDGILQVSKIMVKHGYSDEIQNRVLNDISEISFSNEKIPASIEAKIVQDADRLDALGAIGIARTFTYGGSNGVPIYDKINYCIINHFYDKLLKLIDLMNFDITKKIAKQRHQFIVSFLEQFFLEMKYEISGCDIM